VSNRKLLIVVLVGCLLVVCLYLGFDYFRETKTQNELTDQIKTTSRTLSLVQQPFENLSVLLSEVEKQYQTAVKAVSSSELNSTRIMRAVYEIADESGLKADPLSAGPWTKKAIEGSTYQVMPLSLKIVGPRSSFYSFLTQLENRDPFRCLALENVSIKDTSELANQGITPDAAAVVSVEMNMFIFNRPESGN
jgi:Tfp pilus assembly protein PilO